MHSRQAWFAVFFCVYTVYISTSSQYTVVYSGLCVCNMEAPCRSHGRIWQRTKKRRPRPRRPSPLPRLPRPGIGALPDSVTPFRVSGLVWGGQDQFATQHTCNICDASVRLDRISFPVSVFVPMRSGGTCTATRPSETWLLSLGVCNGSHRPIMCLRSGSAGDSSTAASSCRIQTVTSLNWSAAGCYLICCSGALHGSSFA